MWAAFGRDLIKYGVQVFPLDIRNGDCEQARFDLKPQKLEVPELRIKKTAKELRNLAEACSLHDVDRANEADCTLWLGKLLPQNAAKGLICRNSDYLHPQYTPQAVEVVEFSKEDWSRVKPDIVWYFTLRNLTRSAQTTLKDIFTQRQSPRPSLAVIALNAEVKVLSGDKLLAVRQAIAAALLALHERILIRQRACENHDQSYINDLAQYFFIFRLDDVQLWRLKSTGPSNFEAWQLNVGGGKIDFSLSLGIKRFIKIWNDLISNLVGPVRQSLVADLEVINNRNNSSISSPMKQGTLPQSKEADSAAGNEPQDTSFPRKKRKTDREVENPVRRSARQMQQKKF